MVLRPRNGISLCAGGGGLELGLHLAEPDFACRCFVEWEKDAQAVLVGGMVPDALDIMARGAATGGVPIDPSALQFDPAQPGRHARPFQPAAVWDDVRTFVGDGWRGHINLVSAGYPCQPFSAAGKRAGSDDPRHLWPDVARILWETGAEWGFFENVSGHISLGLETVLRDLWDMGWTPAVGLFSSAETGATHERQRVFIVAHREPFQSGRPADYGGKLANSGCDVYEPEPGNDSKIGQVSGGKRSENGSDVSDGCRRELANADCQESGADLKQSDTQSDGRNDACGSGRTVVDDARHPERGPIDAGRNVNDGNDTGGSEDNSGDGEPSQVVDDATGARCDDARQRTGAHSEGGECVSGDGRGDVGNPAGIGRGEGRPKPEFRRGRDSTALKSGALADRDGQGPQGQFVNVSDTQGRQVQPGLAGLRGGAGLSPPGPSDSAAWGHILRMAPDLAPSLAIRDIICRANDLAAMVAEGRVAETQAQSDLRRMADALAARPRALRLYGNGVDPMVAAHAWRSLAAAHGLRPVDLETTH